MEELKEKIGALCEELGVVPVEAEGQGDYLVEVDDVVLKFAPQAGGRAIVSVAIADLKEDPERVRETPEVLINRNMRLHGARLSKLAARWALTVEPGTDELILWSEFDPLQGPVSSLVYLAEELLNEVDYRRSWMGLAAEAT